VVVCVSVHLCLSGVTWMMYQRTLIPAFTPGIQVTSNAEEAFAGAHAVVLLGGFPRTATMTRGDLLNKNGPIFTEQGRALNKVADKNVKVGFVALVVLSYALLKFQMRACADLRSVVLLKRRFWW